MNNVTAGLIAAIALIAACLSSGCGGSATSATGAKRDGLDIAIREASVYFNNNIPAGSKIAIVAVKSDYQALSEYVIDVITENIVNERRFKVVERTALDAIRAELKFQTSGEVDDNSAQAIGRMAGAQTIVMGTMSSYGNMWRMSLRALSVESAEVLGLFNKNIANAGTIMEITSGPKPPAAIAGSAVREDAVAPKKKPTGGGEDAGTPAQTTAGTPQGAGSTTIANTNNSKFNYSKLTDSRDGKTYKTIKIGSYTWMAENLNYEMDDGRCWRNNEDYCVKYGRLYAVNVREKACPEGWHLSTHDEWTDLVETAKNKGNPLKVLKSAIGWGDSENGTDDLGFSALPGGFRGADGIYGSIDKYGYWWRSSPSFGVDDSDVRMMSSQEIEFKSCRSCAISVRCVQNHR